MLSGGRDWTRTILDYPGLSWTRLDYTGLDYTGLDYHRTGQTLLWSTSRLFRLGGTAYFFETMDMKLA